MNSLGTGFRCPHRTWYPLLKYLDFATVRLPDQGVDFLFHDNEKARSKRPGSIHKNDLQKIFLHCRTIKHILLDHLVCVLLCSISFSPVPHSMHRSAFYSSRLFLPASASYHPNGFSAPSPPPRRSFGHSGPVLQKSLCWASASRRLLGSPGQRVRQSRLFLGCLDVQYNTIYF